MRTDSETDTVRVRLNPFAFVSDAGIRFTLLVILVVCASGRQWFSIAFDVFDLNSKARTCMDGQSVLSGVFLRSDELQHTLTACLYPIMHVTAPCIAVGLVLLAGGTWLVYVAYPWLQIRRLRLERLDPAEVPDLAEALDSICLTAGLRRKPEFWWNPLDGRNLSLAFGTARHCRVALTGAVALQLHTNPDAFRAVLLHELAHIRNGDVGLGYLTFSIWWAFLATTFLPFAIIEIATPQTPLDITDKVVEYGLFILCVLLTRNAVLRARELYADARSFGWHRDTTGLAGVLGALSPIPRMRRYLSPHPAPSRRQRLIYETDEMFRFGTWDAFGIGLSAGFAGVFLSFTVLGLLSPASSQLEQLLTIVIIPVMVVVSVAAGATAIGTWRAAFLALMRSRRRASTLRAAAACATGGVVGGVVPAILGSLLFTIAGGQGAHFLLPNTTSLSLLFLAGAAFYIFSVLLLTVALAAFLLWVEAIARCWLATSLPGASPGLAFSTGLTLCLLVATPWAILVPLVGASIVLDLGQTGFSGPLAIFWYLWGTASIFPLNMIVWCGVVAVWALPLSAALWSPPCGAASWAFLDVPTPATFDLPTVPIRLRRAVLLGITGGSVAILAAVWLHSTIPAEWLKASKPSMEPLVRISPRLLMGVAAQGFVGIMAALTIPRLAVPHAMFAAFVTGCLFSVGEVLHLHSVYAHLSSSYLATAIVLPFVLFGGALVSLGCAAFTCLLTAPLHWLRMHI